MTTTNHELCSLHRWRAGFPALWSQPGLTESHTCQSWQQWSQGMRLQDTRHHSLTELLCSRLTLVALGGGSPSAREDRKAPSCLWLIPQHKNRWSFIYGNHGLWYPNIWTGNWQGATWPWLSRCTPINPKSFTYIWQLWNCFDRAVELSSSDLNLICRIILPLPLSFVVVFCIAKKFLPVFDCVGTIELPLDQDIRVEIGIPLGLCCGPARTVPRREPLLHLYPAYYSQLHAAREGRVLWWDHLCGTRGERGTGSSGEVQRRRQGFAAATGETLQR